MAYLFNSLSDENAEGGKQNIFGGQQTDQGTTTGGAFEKGGASAPPAGGGLSGSGTPPPSGAKAQKAQGSYNPQAASQAYSSASQAIKMPTQALEKAEGSLAKGSQQLQEQANAYGQKAQEASQSYGLDEGTLSKAAAGEGEAYQKTAQRLQAQTPIFEAFQAPEIEGVQALRDPSQLYRAESGPNYSAGQARFDAALLRRNPEFIRRQQELLGRGKALEAESSKKAEEETQKARELVKGAYERETGNIRGRLGTFAGEVTAKAKEKEAAEDLRRAGLDPKEIAKAEQQRIKDEIRADIEAGADPLSVQGRSLGYLSDDYDISPYVNIDRDTDWREFIGSPEAERYNRLQGLLGNAEMLTPNQAGPGAEFDRDALSRNAYKEIMGQITGKRREQDIKNKDQIDAMIKAASDRAKTAQTKDAEDETAEIIKQLNEYRKTDPRYKDKEEPATKRDLMGELREKGLLRENRAPVTWRDVLTADESSQLQGLASDTGLIDEFSAGGYKPEYDIDEIKRYYDQFIGEAARAPEAMLQQDEIAPAPPPSTKTGMGQRQQASRR